MSIQLPGSRFQVPGSRFRGSRITRVANSRAILVNFPVGAFCFAELHTPEPERSAAFYRDLFGWSLQPIADGYWLFRSGESDVVAMRHSATHAWIPFVHIDRIESAVDKASSQGMRLLANADETPRVARTAVLRDQEGAVFGLWEPRGIRGTALETGPGSVWWIELATAAMEPAQQRYASLFDWGVTTTMKFENGPLGYTLFKVGDRSVAGAFQFEPDWGVDPGWQVYYEVENFNASAQRACSLGGSQGFWRDAPHAGRIGTLVDPDGGLFWIAQPLTVTDSATSSG